MMRLVLITFSGRLTTDRRYSPGAGGLNSASKLSPTLSAVTAGPGLRESGGRSAPSLARGRHVTGLESRSMLMKNLTAGPMFTNLRRWVVRSEEHTSELQSL